MPSKTIEVDFDRPRNGPVCFAAEAGDRIKLAWREQHNLHRLSSRNDYDSCAFGAAERLASAGPRPEGVVVDFGGDDAYTLRAPRYARATRPQGPDLPQQHEWMPGLLRFRERQRNKHRIRSSIGPPPACPPPFGQEPLETAFVPLLVCAGGAAVLLLTALAYYRWCRRGTAAKFPARATV